MVLSQYGQGSIKLLLNNPHLLNLWYIFYTNSTLNNTPSFIGVGVNACLVPPNLRDCTATLQPKPEVFGSMRQNHR